MIYKKLPVRKKIYYSDLVYAVTGETREFRKVKKLLPLFFSLEIANQAMAIAARGLRKVGITK